MQLVSAAAHKMPLDALGTHSPNPALTGQRMSSSGLPTRRWPTPTNPPAAAPRKAGFRSAAGTTALPDLWQFQEAEANRRPRARATCAGIVHFDSARRNPYAQKTRALTPDAAVSASARHADRPRVTSSALRAELTVGNQATDLPRAGATRAQVRHFDPARRNSCAQRMRALALDDAMSAPGCHVASPRLPPYAIRAEPTVENQTIDLHHARQPAPSLAIPIPPAATRTPRGLARRHPTMPRQHAGRTVLASCPPRFGPDRIASRAIDLPHARAGRARSGLPEQRGLKVVQREDGRCAPGRRQSDGSEHPEPNALQRDNASCPAPTPKTHRALAASHHPPVPHRNRIDADPAHGESTT